MACMDEGIDTEVLRYTVKPEKREDWIQDKVDSEVQVVIANTKLVQTGLDLYTTLQHLVFLTKLLE